MQKIINMIMASSIMRQFEKPTKNITFSSLIMALLILAGSVEAVWGILQLLGLTKSGHELYPLTGSFFNPGPYGCFLGMTTPAALALITGNNLRLSRLGTIGLLLTSTPLSASMSRTGWIAAASGCVLTWYLLRSDDFRKRLCRFWLWRTLYGKLFIISGVAIVFFGSIYTVYSLKPESAHGRLLIWKVAAMTLSDTPLWGVGEDNVSGVYGEAQEKYFGERNETNEAEVMVAGAPEYLFNEYLQIGVAYGPVAMVAFILIICISLFAAVKGKNPGLAGCMLSFAIICLASYPLRFYLFRIFGSLIAVGCITERCILCRRLRISLAVVVSSLAVLYMLHSATSTVDIRRTELFHTGLALSRAGKYAESDSLMKEVLRVSSDPMPLNILGKNSLAIGDFEHAEIYLRKASHRKPSSLYPHYLLLLLYEETGRYGDALNEAKQIMRMPTKVSSPAEDDIRKKAREVIESYERNI